MTEPIYARLEHELAQAAGDIRHLFRHGRYHQPDNVATRPEGAPMSILTDIENGVRTAVTDVADKSGEIWNSAKNVLEQHLPQLAELAQKAEGNPAIDALLSAVHLSPEALGSIAALITKIDADIAALSPAPAPAPAPEPAPAPAPAQ